MELYCGIDLHGNNSVLAVIDEVGKPVLRRRVDNDLQRIKAELAPFREQMCGVVVESTFNWYWLVDGLIDAGYKVHLANPAAMQQYSGLKYSDDNTDALWLAEMLRLAILPTGYIYPKIERGVRDLLRKRGQMVRQRTSNLLSLQNTLRRSTGKYITGERIKMMEFDELDELVKQSDVAQAVKANLVVIQCLQEQIASLERTVLDRVKSRPGASLRSGISLRIADALIARS